MEGGILFEEVSQRRRFSEEDAADVLRQMLLALNYLKGFAPMPPAPCFLWNGGYEAKWLRKSGSLAWLGAWETLGKTKK